jgi:hypothetical protein
LSNDPLSAREAARNKVWFAEQFTVADVITGFALEPLDADRLESLIAEPSGRSNDHAKAWLHFLAACVECERLLISQELSRLADSDDCIVRTPSGLSLSNGRTLRLVWDGKSFELPFRGRGIVADLYGLCDDICGWFKWPRQSPQSLISECDDPSAAAKCLDNLAAWATGKLAEMEGSNLHATHSPDFHSVNWFGTRYEFTGQQAACVRVLWEAWKKGCPAVGGQAVLEAAGSDAERLPLVFRDHSAWGTMIVPGERKGNYQLKAQPL